MEELNFLASAAYRSCSPADIIISTRRFSFCPGWSCCFVRYGISALPKPTGGYMRRGNSEEIRYRCTNTVGSFSE